MRRHTLYIILLLTMAMQNASAQQDVSFCHYWLMPSFYNPAATAIEGKLDVNAAYANQMTGFEDAPRTIYVGANLPIYFLSAAHSAGASFMNDQTGLFKHMRVSLQYAYHHKFGRKLRLSGGLRFTLLSETFDGSKADVNDTGDRMLATSKVTGTGFDLDFGLRVDYSNLWYAGISMLHLTSPTISFGDEKIYEYGTESSFYLTGGYNIKFHSPLFNMQLDAIVRTNLNAWRGDLTARLLYNGERHHLYGGVGYSPTNSVTFLFGGDFHGITVGYAYEYFTSAIGFVHGTHEITLGYKIDLDLFKKGRNLHKSVRHL